MVVFVIVGKSDPLYEVELGSNGKEDLAYLSQFILHSSLDMVDNLMWTNSSTYVTLNDMTVPIVPHAFVMSRFLKVVDRFNSLVVSAYVTPGSLCDLLYIRHAETSLLVSFHRRVVSSSPARGPQRRCGAGFFH